MALGAELLALGGASRQRRGRPRGDASARSTSGAAAEKFERMVARSAARPISIASARALLPAAPIVVAAAPRARSALSSAIDARAVGLAVVELGGGRARAADPIDPAVGLTELAGLGAEVSADAPLALVHARDEAQAARGSPALAAPPIASATRRRRTPIPWSSALRRIGGMSILVAVTGWDPSPWIAALQAAAAGRTRFVTPERWPTAPRSATR